MGERVSAGYKPLKRLFDKNFGYGFDGGFHFNLRSGGKELEVLRRRQRLSRQRHEQY